MFVEARHEPFAATPDDARGFDTVLVILKALLRREAGHADVVRRLTVARRGAKVDDIYVVMTDRFRLLPTGQVFLFSRPPPRLDARDLYFFVDVVDVVSVERQAVGQLRRLQHARDPIDWLE